MRAPAATNMAAIILLGACLAAAPAGARVAQPPTDSVTLAVVEAPSPRLSTASGIRTLLADPKAREILLRHAPQLVEFFASPQSEGVAPDDTPLEAIARIPQAQDAGLTPDNMRRIADELSRF